MPTFPIDPNLPKTQETRGCSCGMADYGAPGHDGGPSETVRPVGDVTPTLRERIERGAAWLDEVRPDWREHINLATLELSSGYHCVLGQVFNDEVEDPDGDGFDYAVAHVVPVPAPRTPWLVDHGFDAKNFDYDPLTAAWREYLQEG